MTRHSGNPSDFVSIGRQPLSAGAPYRPSPRELALVRTYRRTLKERGVARLPLPKGRLPAILEWLRLHED